MYFGDSMVYFIHQGYTPSHRNLNREETGMQFKQGGLWKACYDEERGLYTASVQADGLKLYEIDKEIFDSLTDCNDRDGMIAIGKGRKLYMEVIDRCGPPYTIVFDDDYKKYCPWEYPEPVGTEWPTEMVDAVVEVMASEEKNREQRRKKRAEREKNKPVE